MKKLTEKKKGKLKWALTIGSIALSIVSIIAVCIGLGNLSKTKTLKNSNWSTGAINESGKVVESKQSAVSKKAYSVDGMAIELDEETATVTYKVAFYAEDGSFISMTEAFDKDFDTSTIPSTAKTFRVVVTPLAVDGEAVELNIFNISKYVSQLRVTFNK